MPRVRWVTLPGPNAPPGVPERGRRGLHRRCIMHLDIVEDMTVEDTPMPGRNIWKWGNVDGERFMRDRAERLLEGANDRGNGRRDDDRDGQSRAPSRNWREKIRRSLSRSGRGRDEETSQRDRDRFGNRRDGRRRDDGGGAVTVATLAQPLQLVAAATAHPLLGPRNVMTEAQCMVAAYHAMEPMGELLPAPSAAGEAVDAAILELMGEQPLAIVAWTGQASPARQTVRAQRARRVLYLQAWDASAALATNVVTACAPCARPQAACGHGHCPHCGVLSQACKLQAQGQAQGGVRR